MKKIFTLGALSLLAASFGSQAQTITLDGRIQTNEKGSTLGLYQSIGTFTLARGFGDWGIKEAFVAEDANYLYVAINGTVENNGNSFQIYFDVPGFTGKPACVALPAAPSASGDPTSFANMAALMDMEVDAGVAYSVRGTLPMGGALGVPQLELCDYRAATPASVVLGAMTSNGTQAVFLTGAAKAAYQDSPQPNPLPPTDILGGRVSTNTNEGLEFAVLKAAYGITNGSAVKIFVLQNNGDGGFLSSDYIPQDNSLTPADPAANLGSGADLCLDVAGTQYVTYTAGSPFLGLPKLNDATINFSVSPNPVADQPARIEFTVVKSQAASVVVTDLLGRTVATLANGILPVGPQSLSLHTASLPSGTYIIKLMIGGSIATRKVSVL